VADEQNTAIAGAVCTLTGSLLPAGGLTVTADREGKFHFIEVPSGQYTLACAAIFVWLYACAESRKTSNDLAYSDLDFFQREVRPRTWIPAALRAAAACVGAGLKPPQKMESACGSSPRGVST